MAVSTYRSVNISSDRDASQRIADAACQLFGEQGFAATSVRQIASAAHVTKPMVYYYFGSKAGLLNRLVETSRAEVETRIAGAIRPQDTCREKLERLAEVHQALSERNLLDLGSRFADLCAEAVSSALAEGERRGEVRAVDAEVFATTFCAALEVQGNAESRHRVVDLLWRGLAAG